MAREKASPQLLRCAQDDMGSGSPCILSKIIIASLQHLDIRNGLTILLVLVIGLAKHHAAAALAKQQVEEVTQEWHQPDER